MLRPLLRNALQGGMLSPLLGYRLADAVGVTVSIADVIVDEGNGTAVLTITRNGEPDVPVSVDYTTFAGSATAVDDFTPTSGTATIPAGGASASETFSVPIIDDAVVEPVETFTVQLSNAVNATIARGTATVTITDNDTPHDVSVSDAAAPQGGQAEFIITAVNGDVPGEVSYQTVDGTATAGSGDYTATSGTVDWTAAGGSFSVFVDVGADATPGETFTLEITAAGANPGNVNIVDDTGVATVEEVADQDAAQAAFAGGADGAYFDLARPTGTEFNDDINFVDGIGGFTDQSGGQSQATHDATNEQLDLQSSLSNPAIARLSGPSTNGDLFFFRTDVADGPVQAHAGSTPGGTDLLDVEAPAGLSEHLFAAAGSQTYLDLINTAAVADTKDVDVASLIRVADSGGMYVDSAGTQPAVLADPIGRLRDASGNDNHALQATTANKLQVLESGGVLYLAGANGDYADVIFAQPIPQPFELVFAGRFGQQAVRYVCDSVDGNDRVYLYRTTDSSVRFRVGSQVEQTTGTGVLEQNEYGVVRAVANGVNSFIEVNGISYPIDAGTDSLHSLRLMSAFTGGGSGNTDLSAFMVIGAALNEAAFGPIRTLFGNKIGITL